MLFKNIETERLLLRNIDIEDRDFIFSMFSDDTVNRYLFDADPLTKIKEADEIIEFYMKPEPRLQHRWIIIRKSDGVKMGTCGFHFWQKDSNKVEISCDLKEEFETNGYMQEAFKEIISFAKTDMLIKEITASIYVANERAIKLIESLGFVLSDSRYEVFRKNKYLHKIYSLNLEVS
ncbi:GNAT family N-acetyltransferase [Clostridium cellulovorans]|uniref:GCN5-related N-acetyltransferase n=1 Tax=Clostridium cellulovorans (strain ATCC 35296 / DSM 3052 / OCM 3 / 743B) TaxID=573061 RepID=D9SPL4_CLOC7|nr:GNAT family N-acetyltransferase [Clostridium cellulovorans]ADL50063.1 GCN5-related N-acetyltransferase [Clostridium cellulovorans 743B]